MPEDTEPVTDNLTIDPDTQGSDPEPPVEEKPAYEAPSIDPVANGRDILLEVKVEDGDGSALVGLDVDSIESVHLVNAKGEVEFGPSHTISIASVSVTGANVQDGTVLVAVTPKG